MRIDHSLSNRSGEFNIASISDNSPKERTDNQTFELAAADDKGRRNAVPSAGKDNNLKGPSLVRLQHQVYIPPFHGCDFDVSVDIRNSKGVKVCEPLNLPPGLCVAHSVVTIPHHKQNHSKPSIVVRILNISPIPQTINKHTPILTLADVTVLEGQDIPVTKNTIAQVEFNLQHMEVSGKEVFQQFLHTYEDIFAKTGKPLEATKVIPIRYLGTEPTLEPIRNRERIQRSQQDDPAVRNITGHVLRNNSQDYYLDLDGVLYRKSEDSRHGDLLVAPTALLPEIMMTYHDLPISGHTGYDKTYARIKKMFIWPGMSKDIKKYVDACISCAQRKTSPHAKPAPLERDMDYPLDEIFKPLQVRYDADSNYIAEFMQRMKIAHRNAIQTIEATTDRVHGQFNTKAKEPGFAIGDRLYLYQPAIQAGLTSKLAKKWIGPYRITHLRGVNARIEEIHGRKEQLVHVNRLKAMFGHRRPERPIRAEVQTISGAGLQVARGNKKAGGWGINKSVSASTGEVNRSGEKLTTGQPEFPPAEGPTSSGHPRGVTATTGPPEDFEGPITRTQKTTDTPRTATTGAEAGRRAVPDYGTEFGDGWRGLFTPAWWNQEGEGLSIEAEQPRGPRADLKEEEYLPNPISHQERSPVSKDLVVFEH
ncbi:hypothetical protein JTB14_035210 [Gonioctena quinquepunctata]|nr:hypothetical protein JTB14_035210 [Gonioctena quinquepunctata]